ncbi:actin nucleation-promoting factor WAS-like [Watersipora subatra]|uniref:actin nucleation-promoting factor WAS-like n=1 Tax=Watersipora subatra TaxID=2589382 RepID=UPI00355B5453
MRVRNSVGTVTEFLPSRHLPPPPPWHGSSLAPNDSQYLKPVPTTAPSGSPLPRSRNRSGSALDVAPPPPYSTRPQRPTATPPPPPPPPPSSGVPGPPPPSSARARPLPPPPLNAIEKARELKHLDADMKSPFDMAGILKAALEDEDIRKKIYEIIEKQVSKDAVKNKNDNHGLPPAPRPAAPKSAAPSSAAARRAQPPRRIRGFPALGGAPLPFPSTRRQGFTAATPPPPHQSGVSVPPRTPSAGARPPAPPLNAIEKARQPKHIDHSPLPVKVTEERGGNLLNAPKNMVQRNQAVNPSGDSDEEDDDDEWDED